MIPVLSQFRRRRQPITAAFSPTSIAGLQLWLKADAGVFSDAGVTPAVDTATVQQWNDQSAARNFFQSTAADRPTFRTGIKNGKPVVRFDGINDWLSGPGAAQWTCGTILIVEYIESDPVILCGAFGTNQGNFLVRRHVDASWRGVGNTNADDFTNGGTFLLNGVSQNAQAVQTWRIIRARAATAAAFTGVARVSTPESSRFFHGDVAEVLNYDTILSDGDCASLEAYLNNRWAIF